MENKKTEGPGHEESVERNHCYFDQEKQSVVPVLPPELALIVLTWIRWRPALFDSGQVKLFSASLLTVAARLTCNDTKILDSSACTQPAVFDD